MAAISRGYPGTPSSRINRRTAHTDSFKTVDEYADRFAEHLRRLLERTDAPGGASRAGVVFAGFGTEQLFPALSYYRITTTGAGGMTVDGRGKIVIGRTTRAAIRPFGQKDMVATFMEGTYPGYRAAVEGFAEATVNSMVDDLVDRLGAHCTFEELGLLRQTAGQMASDVLKQLKDMADSLGKNHWTTIIDTVVWLPKEDLASTAEALVGLTSLWQRVTPGSETVGGPIDVAVISKGDGLVWIKRKHYFDPALNFRYLERNRLG